MTFLVRRNQTYADKDWVINTLQYCEDEMPGHTQKRAILYLLLQAMGRWVCGSYFLSAYIPTYSQRISELVRKDGEPIESRECDMLSHRHRSTVHMYRIKTEEDE